MGHWKMRLLGLLFIAGFGALLYYEWEMLRSEGSYHLKATWLAPLGITGGIFILLFPTKAGRPETTRDKLLALLVFIIGMAAGLLNWYLMDPNFFSFR
jgi:hypothetical protein